MLYGTLDIILGACRAAFITPALWPTLAGMAHFAPNDRRAARLDGAGLPDRLRHVLLPLVGSMAVAAGILVLMTAGNELTVSAPPWTSSTEALGVVFLVLDASGCTARAAAGAGLAVLAILAQMPLAHWLDRRSGLGVLPWSAAAET